MSEVKDQSSRVSVEQPSGRRRYEPPRLVRVSVNTARTTGGPYYSDTYCTVHGHSSSEGDCQFT